jgi:hypothetical protein
MASVPHPDSNRQDKPQTEHEFHTFLQWERASRDTIDVKKIYIDMAGDLVAGIVLSQLVYWYLPDKQGKSKIRIKKDGTQWIAKARHDWWDECRITPKQIDRAYKILEAKGLIETRTYRFNGAPTKHVRIIHGAFIQAWGSHIATPMVNPFLPNGGNPISPNGKNELPETVKTITETTAETTAENNKHIAPAIADAPPPTFQEVDSAIYDVPESVDAAPEGPAVPRDTIPAIIKAWLDSSGVIDSKAYGKKGYRAIAEDLINAGITADDVTRFVKARRTDPFWSDKGISLHHVATNIVTWLEAAPRTSTPPPTRPEHMPFDFSEPGKVDIEEAVENLPPVLRDAFKQFAENHNGKFGPEDETKRVGYVA